MLGNTYPLNVWSIQMELFRGIYIYKRETTVSPNVTL